MNQTGRDAAGKNVLVVEDEIMIRLLLEDMLGDLGYNIAAAVGRVDDAGNLHFLGRRGTRVKIRGHTVDLAEIEAALGTALAAPPADAPRAPGTLAAHYAPRTPLALAEGNLALELAASLARQGKRVAVLARATARPLQPGIEWHIAPPDAAGYAHALYSCLRRLDEAGCDAIVVEKPPQAPEWAAINDRLARAAAGSSDGDET